MGMDKKRTVANSLHTLWHVTVDSARANEVLLLSQLLAVSEVGYEKDLFAGFEERVCFRFSDASFLDMYIKRDSPSSTATVTYVFESSEDTYHFVKNFSGDYRV